MGGECAPQTGPIDQQPGRRERTNPGRSDRLGPDDDRLHVNPALARPGRIASRRGIARKDR
jgi:hypothetical protein